MVHTRHPGRAEAVVHRIMDFLVLHDQPDPPQEPTAAAQPNAEPAVTAGETDAEAAPAKPALDALETPAGDIAGDPASDADVPDSLPSALLAAAPDAELALAAGDTAPASPAETEGAAADSADSPSSRGDVPSGNSADDTFGSPAELVN